MTPRLSRVLSLSAAPALAQPAPAGDAAGPGAAALSDWVYRIPRVRAGAPLGEGVARQSKRAAEGSAGEDARLAYYEWLRSRLQVLVAQRQLAQVQTTLKQGRALGGVRR